MADTVTFNSDPVLDAGEGAILSCARGTINRDKIFEPMARGDGEFVKYLNKKGTDHQVTIQFVNVGGSGKPTISEVVTRMQDLADLKVIATLDIPDFGINASNCVVSNVEETDNVPAIELDFSSATLEVGSVRNITYDITFRQLK